MESSKSHVPSSPSLSETTTNRVSREDDDDVALANLDYAVSSPPPSETMDHVPSEADSQLVGNLVHGAPSSSLHQPTSIAQQRTTSVVGASSSSSSKELSKNKNSRWTEDSTSVLLEAWLEGLEASSGKNKNISTLTWTKIANRVSKSSATKRTEVQCRERIHLLKKMYKIEKEKREQEKMGMGSVEASTERETVSKYYERMEDIIKMADLVPQKRKKKEIQIQIQETQTANMGDLVRGLVKELGQVPTQLVKGKGKVQVEKDEEKGKVGKGKGRGKKNEEKRKRKEQTGAKRAISLALKDLGVEEDLSTFLDGLTPEKYTKSLRDLALIMAGRICSVPKVIESDEEIPCDRMNISRMIELNIREVEGKVLCLGCGTIRKVRLDWREGYLCLASYLLGRIFTADIGIDITPPSSDFSYDCLDCNQRTIPYSCPGNAWNFLFLAFTFSVDLCPRDEVLEYLRGQGYEEEEISGNLNFYMAVMRQLDPTNVGWNLRCPPVAGAVSNGEKA